MLCSYLSNLETKDLALLYLLFCSNILHVDNETLLTRIKKLDISDRRTNIDKFRVTAQIKLKNLNIWYNRLLLEHK